MRFLALVIGIVFFPVALFVAANTAKVMNLWVLLVALEIVLVGAAWFLLSFGVPENIVEVSRGNCYRMDGTKSSRRSRREFKATMGFRLDLLAFLIMVAFSGNALVLVIDSFVIPLSFVSDSLGLFSFDLDLWRTEISDRNLDRDYSLWRGVGQLGNHEVQQQPHFVKTAFPVVFGAMLAWVVGCLCFVRYSYQCAMQKYCMGIRSRCNEYLNLDIGRMQG